MDDIEGAKYPIMHRYIFAVGVNATFPLVAKEISIETLYQSGQRLVLVQWTKTKEL